jgi:uncharacterized protein (DUF1330 family)
MTVTLCVLLWPRPGAADALVAYEDAVLPLVTAHGGQVRERVRTDGGDDAPLEIHVLEFPSDAALDAYMSDPQRQALADVRDRAIETTSVYRVDRIRS